LFNPPDADVLTLLVARQVDPLHARMRPTEPRFPPAQITLIEEWAPLRRQRARIFRRRATDRRDQHQHPMSISARFILIIL
jgi:hypothetical protein